MSYNRITSATIASNAMLGIQSAQSRLAKLQSQLSSGKALQKPSDDPAGVSSALSLRSELARLTQYDRNTSDGQAWLGTIDSTLQTMVSATNRVRDIVVQGSSTGAMSASDRQALATEVAGLRQSLIGDANTTYLGRPVFGGTTAGTAAYDASGAYLGDSQVVTRRVGDGQTVRVDLTGPEAFSGGGTDLFALLSKIQTDLTGTTANLAGDLTSLDSVLGSMRTGLADVGARSARLDSLAQTSQLRSIDATSALSSVEDVDTAKAILDLNVQQAAYTASLQATAKVIQPSLMDYLR